jgi:hypothetical protein
MGWWERTLFGVVSADLTLRFSSELVGIVELVLRFVVEVLGLGRTVSISAGAVLGSRLLLGLDIAGWLFGWLLFWLLLFQSTPLFFPRQGSPDDPDSDWTAGLANRFLLATATVGIGVSFEGWLAALETRLNVGSLVSSPVSVSPVAFGGLLAVTLVGYVAVATLTTTTRVDRKYLYIPSDRYEGGTVTGDRYLLAVVVLGAILATMAVLFPLPELLLVSLQTADVLVAVGVVGTSAEYVVAARNDIIEGMTGAVLSVWEDLEEVFHLVYIVAPLLLFWVLAIETVAGIAFDSVLASSPLGLAGLGLCLLTIGVQVTFHSYRLSERVRDRLVDAESATHEEALNTETKPRIPLFLGPAALAWFVPSVLRTRQGSGIGGTAPVVSELPFAPELVLLGVLVFVLSILTVTRPGWFPNFDGGDDESAAARDHAAAAIGMTVFVTAPAVAGQLYAGAIGLPRAVALVVLLGGTLLAPWLAPRVLLGGEGSEWDRLTTGILKAGAIFVVSLVVGLAIGIVVTLSFGGTIPRRLYAFVSLPFLPMYVSGIALVLFVFLLPFHYGSRGG